MLDGKYIVLEDKDLKGASIEKGDVILIKDLVQEEGVVEKMAALYSMASIGEGFALAKANAALKKRFEQ